MSLFRKESDASPQPAAAPAAAPAVDPNPPVSRAEFSALDERLAKLTESIETLASRPIVVQSPTAAPAAPPDVSDEEIDAAIADGKGAAGIKRLVERRLDAARREVSAEVGAMREYGTTMLGSVAERAFIAALPEDDKRLLQRFEKEVRGLVNQCEPALRGHPETWETAFNTIIGQHRREIEHERIEAAMRRQAEEAAAAAAPRPGASGAPGRGDRSEEEAVPSIAELAGDFPHLGEMTEEEFIKKINRGKPHAQRYKDWNDYIARGRQVEAQLAALRDGSDDGGVGPLPASLR